MATSAVTDSSNLAQQTAAQVENSKSAAAKQSLFKNFDSFLTMFLTQLKNQDPLSPMDTNQFTTNLASLAAVEQSVNSNANLEKIVSLLNSSSSNTAVSYLNKNVEYETNLLTLKDGKANFSYTLDGTANSAEAIITAEDGSTVRTAPMDKSEGKHNITWDGTDDLGNPVPDGQYKIVINAKGENEAPITARISNIGTVSSVVMQNGTPLLKVGTEEIDPSGILSIQG